MNYIKKYSIVFLLGIIGFFAFFIPVKNFAEQKKSICKNCNVILITLDILGSNHLPCYGYERNTAPNLCKFAEGNVFFTRSYSQNPGTLPSTFSILTSQYPSVHGMKYALEDKKLDKSLITLPEVLKNNGYKTIYLGLIDNAQIPLDRGIKSGFDIIENQLGDPSKWQSFYKLFLSQKETDKPIFTFIYSGFLHSPYLVEDGKKLRFTDTYYSHIPTSLESLYQFDVGFFQYVLSSLDKRVRNSNSTESKNRNMRFLNSLRNALSLQEAEKIFLSFPKEEARSYFHDYYLKKVDVKNAKQLEYFRALYYEKLYIFDKRLGEFFEFLNSEKIKNDTIVILTSQHGEMFGEHGTLIHSLDMYKQQISVPMILAIPGLKHIKRDEIFQGIDIYPTLLSLLGLKKESKLQGKDLSDLIYGIPGGQYNEYAIAEYGGPHEKLIHNRDWSFYTRLDSNISELYNLQTDPGEYTNAVLQYPHIAGRMLNTLNNVFPSQYEEKKEYNFPLWIDEIKKQKIIKEGYF